MKRYIIIMTIAWLLDLVLGDPYGWPHPVKMIGRLISQSEKYIRRIFPDNQNGQRNGGILLAVMIPVIAVGTVHLLLVILAAIHPFLRGLAEVWICYQLLAVKSLRDESMKVYEQLEYGSLTEARTAVSMIVGRDTKQLSEEGVIKATVETIAENASDGVIAPMLYMCLFGVYGAVFYKAVNTMDSMVGYQNERYRYFGTAAAKLDDLCNLLPARIAAVLMMLASALLRLDFFGAVNIYRRDKRNHKSPNSAHTEAVCAGALQIQLAGDASYFGVIHHKPTIGDPLRPVCRNDIKKANDLMVLTSLLMVLTSLLMAGSACMLAAVFHLQSVL